MARNKQIMVLNKLGIDKFREFIADRMDGNTNISVDSILSNSACIEVTPFKTPIDLDKKFEDRYELANYLYAAMVNEYSQNKSDYGLENRKEDGKSVGLWSWFALVYFEQLYDHDSSHRPTSDAHFIFQPHEGRRWYRHSVFSPFYLVDNYPDLARVMISSEIATMGQMIESTISRYHVMNSEAARESINKLYADPDNNGKWKEGSSSQPETNKLKQLKKNGAAKMQGYGGIERFALELQKIKLTHHIQGVDSDVLIDLMGDEFKHRIV